MTSPALQLLNQQLQMHQSQDKALRREAEVILARADVHTKCAWDLDVAISKLPPETQPTYENRR